MHFLVNHLLLPVAQTLLKDSGLPRFIWLSSPGLRLPQAITVITKNHVEAKGNSLGLLRVFSTASATVRKGPITVKSGCWDSMVKHLTSTCEALSSNPCNS